MPLKSVARALATRREVWLPSLWGWLLILMLAALLLSSAVFAGYGFLAQSAPATAPDGRGAQLLVVEGWIGNHDLDQAIAVFRRGKYQRVVTSGEAIEAWSEFNSYAERAAHYLSSHGLGDVKVIALPAPAVGRDRTFSAAVEVRRWVQRSGVDTQAMDVFTAGAHARRSRLLYRMAMGPGVEIGVLASRPTTYDGNRWWHSSEGTRVIVSETLGLAWAKCCFWPASDRTSD